MSKHLIIFSLFITLFFTACSSYSVTKYFEKDDFYNRALQYTKKADILKDNEISIMLNATYLNSLDSKYNNEYENFIIGVYHTNSKVKGLKNKDYILLLNNKEPEIINPIKIAGELNNLPLKNYWAKYYLISFKKEKFTLLEKSIHDLELSYENILKRNKNLHIELRKEKKLKKRKEIIKKLQVTQNMSKIKEKMKQHRQEVDSLEIANNKPNEWKASLTFLKEL